MPIRQSFKITKLYSANIKAPITTAADNKFCDNFPNIRKNKDDSHEISCLICYFWKSCKIWNCRLLQIIGGTLWVKWFTVSILSSVTDNCPSWIWDRKRIEILAHRKLTSDFLSWDKKSYLTLMSSYPGFQVVFELLQHGHQVMSLLCLSDVIISCGLSAYSRASGRIFKHKMHYLMVSKKKNPLFVHASWCQMVILRTDFSIPSSHLW